MVGRSRGSTALAVDAQEREALRNALRIAAAALISVALLPGTFAQTPTAQPATDIPKLVENIDVRVINVDVVVTDKKGTVITGLNKDDFEIFENGVPKPISNFYAVEGGRPTDAEAAAAAPARRRPDGQAVVSREAIPDSSAAPDHLLHRQPVDGSVQPQSRLQEHEGVRRRARCARATRR